ncbi:MAG: hypothetical protein CL607_24420 [Anaerolineaceae bacterium]|nr:hypothetical protein [Anaerolineaceae bacterium]
MKPFYRLAMVACLCLLMGVTVWGQDAPLGFAEGDPVIEPNFGDDIKTLNPIIVADGPSQDVINRLFPVLIQYNPFTLAWNPGEPRGLAESWTISDDGRVYTFQLSDEYYWNDGTPVTTADIMWFWNATINEDTNSNNQLLIDQVESMVAVDDYTLEVTFKVASCTALDTLNPVTAVPAHAFEEWFGSDLAGMEDSEFNLDMPVTGLDFTFDNFRPGEQVTLRAYENYPDPVEGSVIPAGYIYKTVTDQVVQMEQFYAGELTWLESVPQSSMEEVRTRSDAGEFQIFEAPANTIRFLSFNLADPENPQDAVDEDGNPLDQGVHPILGDKRVRQALALAMNYDEINEGAFFGNGIPVASHVLPTSWAYPEDLAPYPFDPDAAGALLDEAGWTDEDGDGIRECNGCETTEDGTPLSFKVETNAGNVSQEALYTILQDQWSQIGVDAQVSFLDFNILVDSLLAQNYDAIGLFWNFSIPANPDDATDVFTPSADVIGSGFNTGSYNNPRVTELLEEARLLPGCDQAERAAIYGEMYEILADELPWLWLSTSTVMSAAQGNLENWDPQAGFARWNIDAWTSQSR